MTTPKGDPVPTGTHPSASNMNQRALTISLPLKKLRKACENWAKVAAVLRSYEESEKQAATCEASVLESRFLLADESCCEICFTLGECVAQTPAAADFVFDRQSLGTAVFSFDYPSVKVWGYDSTWQFALAGGMVSPWESFFTRVPQGRSPMDKIRRLVSRCDSPHSCYETRPEKAPALPTRVLDISRGLDKIRLREGAGIKDRYICLSHRWGSKQPLQTTTKNLETHQQHIPWDLFPVVYKEAILISLDLGIKYIWIDSLCIIQDSVVDWVLESQRMCNVYAGSYLTVAATSSPNCSFSMLEPLSNCPRAERNRTTRVHLSRDGALEAPAVLAMVEGEHGYWDESSYPYGDVYQDLPLLSRAWTFQEQLLSTRLVHLTRTEIGWQCKRGVLCDCGYMTSSGEEPDILFYRAMEEKLDTVTTQDSGKQTTAVAASGAFGSLWGSIAMRYSKRKLTYDKDELPALSGLAHEFAQRRGPGTRYLAGLWWCDEKPECLLADLLWHRSVDPFSARSYKISETRSRDWIAPTFSWASIRALVVFPVNLGFEPIDDSQAKGWLEEVYVDVLEARCEPETLDPMGRVKAGFLKVTGRALRGRVRVTKMDHFPLFDIELEERDGIVYGDAHRGVQFIPDVEREQVWQDGVGEVANEKPHEVDVVCVPWARVCRSIFGATQATPVATDLYGGEEWAVVLHSGGETKCDFESCVFNRVGMLRGRRSSGATPREQYENFWAENPGLFQDGGQEVHTFTIV